MDTFNYLIFIFIKYKNITMENTELNYTFISYSDKIQVYQKIKIIKPNRNKIISTYNYINDIDYIYNDNYNWNNMKSINEKEMYRISILLKQLPTNFISYISNCNFIFTFWICNGEGNCPFTIIDDNIPYNHIILNTIDISINTLCHELLHIYYKINQVWKVWYNNLWSSSINYNIINKNQFTNIPIRFNPDNLFIGYYNIVDSLSTIKFIIYPIKNRTYKECKTDNIYFIYNDLTNKWIIDNNKSKYILNKYFKFNDDVNIESPDEIWIYLVLNYFGL